MLLFLDRFGKITGKRHRKSAMARKTRSPIDRRSGSDRRKAYHVGYFMNGGVERRSGKERRTGKDRRKRLATFEDWPGEQSECIPPEKKDRE